MQLAYYMGMNPVYVVGLDHYYDQSGSVKKRGRGIVSEGDDPNHFHKEYFGKGIRWDPPNLRMSEKAYRLARTYYNAHHRQLWNATEKTALSEDILPKIKYESLFDV
jgi:hypothetical protein